MAKLNVTINNLKMKNPIMTASGTFGYGLEFNDFIPIDEIGGIIVKGTTLEPRQGNDYPRMAETSSGMLNCVGLQNKGVDYFCEHIYPTIKEVNTNMIVNGLNKNGLKKFGAEAYCLVADPDVAREAKERGITRSMVGLERALKDPQTKIFVIGNAPTALFTLLEKMEKEGENVPKLIVGVPVGFVGCPESKAELSKYNVPFIRTNGTKGGSTVAVGVMHGILYQMYERDKYFNN